MKFPQIYPNVLKIQHNFEKGYVKVFFSSKMSLYKLKTKRSNSELLGLSIPF